MLFDTDGLSGDLSGVEGQLAWHSQTTHTLWLLIFAEAVCWKALDIFFRVKSHLNHDFNRWHLCFSGTFFLLSTLLRQSLIILACVGAVGLGVSLLVLAVYVVCLCCCRRDIDEDTKRPDTCCVTWVAVITGLIIWWVKMTKQCYCVSSYICIIKAVL